MRRSNQPLELRRRLPAWLALFALLVQFTASFGHLHALRYVAHGSGMPAFTTGDGSSGGSAPFLPVDTDCPICASAQLLGNSTLPGAVALLAPLVAELAAFTALDELRLTAPDHLLFTSRGPPLV
jgi:hypothetical protein